MALPVNIVYQYDPLAETYYQEIKVIPVLTDKQERLIILKAKEGSMLARNILIASNLRFAFLMAAAFYHKATIQSRPGIGYLISLSDLIQQANLGLFKGFDNFNPAKGVKFLTYAEWWIRQQMARYQEEKGYRGARIPIHVLERLRMLKRVRQSYYSHQGCWPTRVELATALGVSIQDVEGLEKLERERTVSIDKPVELRDEEGDEFSELISSRLSLELNLEINLCRFELRWVLKRLFVGLTSTEKTILILRFGLCTSKRYTLLQIGKLFNLSRERIRQIEGALIERLKRTATSDDRKEVSAIRRRIRQARYQGG